ncbi:hypothetical protein OG570_35955 [Amycolatopsis sp. NBC_01286]|nr:hypothetical protein OG570_35955 [Amycolatopsis sp. NBC_01286]
MGLPFPPVGERFERLDETVRPAFRMWDGDASPFEGAHYRPERPIGEPASRTAGARSGTSWPCSRGTVTRWDGRTGEIEKDDQHAALAGRVRAALTAVSRVPGDRWLRRGRRGRGR